MNDFTLREKVIIKLMIFLIEFVGKKENGFYAHQLDNCLHEVFYPKFEMKDK